jgi:hypothetical protein
MAYGSLLLGQPGQPVCPDAYNNESTLVCPKSKRLILQVSVQAVMVQLGIMTQGVSTGAGGVQWQPEQPYLPLMASFGRNFDAVRVRNFTKGAAAQVLLSVE